MNDGREYLGEPADPATRLCEWCDEPAVEAITLIAWKEWLYCCADHIEHGKKAVAKGPSHRPNRRQGKNPNHGNHLFDPTTGRLFEEAA